tara:strand:- start:315 stop:518 length:204 start_codon:yes stop_codon:yes gene_type:complete
MSSSSVRAKFMEVEKEKKRQRRMMKEGLQAPVVAEAPAPVEEPAPPVTKAPAKKAPAKKSAAKKKKS